METSCRELQKTPPSEEVLRLELRCDVAGAPQYWQAFADITTESYKY